MAIDFKLYLITDRKQTKMPLPEAVRRACEGGVKAIQLREKDLPVRELLTLAQDVRGTTSAFGAKLFINDRVDIAVAVEADGVHLGRQSMPPQAVRMIESRTGKRLLIGVSAHTPAEAKDAENSGADFITYGPLFQTPSKKVFGAPVGLDSLKKVKNDIKIPMYGLGGIKRGSIKQVVRSGAYGISMISEIFAADDIEAKAREIVAMAEQQDTGEGGES